MVVLHTCKNEEDLIKNEGAMSSVTLNPILTHLSIYSNGKV